MRREYRPGSDAEWQADILEDIVAYLENGGHTPDEDPRLIVEFSVGEEVRFGGDGS